MTNFRGAMMMVLAMGLFAIEDGFIKVLTDTIPVGQIIAVTCLGGLIYFVVVFRMQGKSLWHPEYLDRKVILRTLCDAGGSLCFVTSLSLIPLTTASAVIQATPLVVALGAALFLGQSIGWRRWIAIIVGFIGVMIIIRPGMEGFEPAVLFSVAGMLGLAVRDLFTRALDVSLTGSQLSVHSFTMLIIASSLMMWIQGESVVIPNGAESLLLLGCIIVGVMAYLALVAATRGGNAGIISSFRYSRMIFALIIGFIAFREVPDTATMIGATIVIASGVFTLLREARLRRASHFNQPKV